MKYGICSCLVIMYSYLDLFYYFSDNICILYDLYNLYVFVY